MTQLERKRTRAAVGFALAAALICHTPGARAQSAEILAVSPAGTGARPTALGEAYQALGGDIYSLRYNPAGLGLARGLAIEGGLNHRTTRLDTRYFGNPVGSRVYSTALDALGIVYAVPTEQGSLVFALAGHRLRDFDNRYRIEGYNTSDDPDLGETWIEATDADLGAVYGYAAGAAIEVSPGTFIGVSLEAISGTNSYTYLLDAYDTEDVWAPYDGHRWDDGIDYTYRSRGLRLGLGFLWRPMSLLAIGGDVKMPARIDITENWYQSEVLYYDDGTSEYTWDESGVFTYSFQLPYELSLGGALSVGAVTLTAGGTYLDYSQSSYNKAPYDGYDPDFFHENYEPQWKAGGGIEFAIPHGPALRAGYQWSPLLYRPLGLEVVRNREIYSLGLGLPMGNAIRLGLTWRQTEWETLSGTSTELWKTGQFLVSFGYRF